jgi:hypothetical protein
MNKTNDASKLIKSPHNQSRLALSIRLLPCCHIVIIGFNENFPFIELFANNIQHVHSLNPFSARDVCLLKFKDLSGLRECFSNLSHDEFYGN